MVQAQEVIVGEPPEGVGGLQELRADVSAGGDRRQVRLTKPKMCQMCQVIGPLLTLPII